MNLEEDLKALGNTPHDIAVNLFLKGITGYIGDPCQCPIANYLTGCGYNNVEVKHRSVSTEKCSCLIPDSMVEFISKFDDGIYPKLLAE